MPDSKQKKATKVIFVKECPVALHNAFMAKAKLHGMSFKDAIINLMRKWIKPKGDDERNGPA